MLAKIAITALSIIIGFRILYFLNKNLSYSSGIKKKVGYSLPVIELLIWIGLVIFYIKNIYATKNYYALISVGVLLVIFSVPAFIFIRDFLTGFYLKFQNRINTGSYISFDNMEGKINKTGHFSLSLTDQQGNIKNIPYHKIGSKIITQQGSNPELEKMNMVFSISEKKYNRNTLAELKKNLLTTPWVAVSQPIIIEKVWQENNRYYVKVDVYALNHEYSGMIQSMIEERMDIQ